MLVVFLSLAFLATAIAGKRITRFEKSVQRSGLGDLVSSHLLP